MLSLSVSITGNISCAVSPADEAIVRRANANALYLLITRNFKALGGTRFWGDAIKSTLVEELGDVAVLTVSHKGVRLQYLGGVVKPSGRTSEVTGRPITSLLVPLKGSPLKGKELGDLPIAREDIRVIPREGKASLLAQVRGKGKDEVVTPLAVLLKQSVVTPHDNVFPSVDKQVEIIQAQTERTMQQITR